MHEIRVPILSNDQCGIWIQDKGKKSKVPRNMMCAGYKNGGKDACKVPIRPSTYVPIVKELIFCIEFYKLIKVILHFLKVPKKHKILRIQSLEKYA